MAKTNAIRIIEAAGIDFKIHEYGIADGKIDGESVALKCGLPPEMVFKTLVANGKNIGPLVFIVPVTLELDLKKGSIASGSKNIEMIRQKDLEPLTGYIHGGCSPIGMKKQFPVFIDETALLCETISVSAGRPGLQVELKPKDLADLAKAGFYDLA